MWKFKFFLTSALLVSLSAEAQSIACAKLQETPLTGASCCEGLKLNSTSNLCEDAIQDPALTYCMSDVDCGTAFPGQGKGCFRLSDDDIFSGEAQSPAQFTPISDQEDTVDEATDKNTEEDGLPDGSTCIASSDCNSFSCDATTKKCVEKKICRFGDIGEAVPSGVRCEENLIVNPQGICDMTEEDKKLFYMGLIEEDVTVKTNNKCDLREYQNDPQMKDIREKSIVSMKTLRAMEFLFTTSSLKEEDECMKVLPFMREGMAKKYNEERKKILNNFNIEMAKIEKDNQTLQNAKPDSDAMVQIHGEAIKEKDLATRKTSGFDAMKIMWRRNLLFQAYEKAMATIIKEAATKVGGLAEEMGKWKDKGKKWTVGGKEWTYKTAGKCRGKKGKKIKKRWANYYQIKATSGENGEIINRQAITDYLTLVSGDAPSTIKGVLKNGPKSSKFSTYFLVDPLMPGGNVNFENIGTGKKSKRQLGDKAYPELYKTFRERLVEFYKGMKGSASPADFVYEPEIISTEARNCIDQPQGPKCELYSKFIDEMTDITFAQFLAYSIHSKNSYKKYFPKGDNLRRKLLAKYEVDMQNVVKYYDSMASARDEQTRCLELSINNVAQTILDDGPGVVEDTKAPLTTSGSGSGDTLGSASLTSGSGSGSGSGPTAAGVRTLGTGTSGTQTTNPLRITDNTRTTFEPRLNAGSQNNLVVTGKLDNMASSNTSAGSASLGASSNQFAARLINMKDANNKARATGTNFSAKNKIIAAASQNLSRSSAATLSATDSKVASSNLGSGSAALEIVPKNIEKEAEADLNRKLVELNKAAPAGGVPAFSEGQALPGAASTSGPVISNEDQEVIEANYERSKGEYASDEEDALFSKVSKAYVRNLGKVLNKKKKVEE